MTTAPKPSFWRAALASWWIAVVRAVVNADGTISLYAADGSSVTVEKDTEKVTSDPEGNKIVTDDSGKQSTVQTDPPPAPTSGKTSPSSSGGL